MTRKAVTHRGLSRARLAGRAGIAAALLMLSAGPALACLWDTDTIGMERRRFPGVNELIVGKFLRHSPEFYAARIKDRRARLAALGPDDGSVGKGSEAHLALLDDLAVALDKTGKPEEAAGVMRQALALAPERYETHANLGTHLIHSGQYKEGLEHLKRAIAINPDAHFGRERYQIYVVEYVLARRESPTCRIWDAEGGERVVLRTETSPKLPLSGMTESYGRAMGLDNIVDPDEREQRPESGFVPWLAQHAPESDIGSEEGLKAAVKGVLGMMRFGRHDSPVLLEVLGDLLLTSSPSQSRLDAKLMAGRAYLMASRAEGLSDAVRAHYRKIAEGALAMQTPPGSSSSSIGLERVERDLEAELAEAKAFTDAIAAQERQWIAEGADVEQRFAEVYFEAPTLKANDGVIDRARASSPAIFYTLLVMLLAVLVWYLVRAVKLILLRLISGPSTAPDEAPESSRA